MARETTRAERLMEALGRIEEDLRALRLERERLIMELEEGGIWIYG